MTITEWFEPYNLKHIEAFEHLTETGFWPEGFVPDTVEVEICHQINIVAKMGHEWVKYMTKGV